MADTEKGMFCKVFVSPAGRHNGPRFNEGFIVSHSIEWIARWSSLGTLSVRYQSPCRYSFGTLTGTLSVP